MLAAYSQLKTYGVGKEVSFIDLAEITSSVANQGLDRD